MWNKYNLDSFIFMDIETTTQTKLYKDLPNGMDKNWEERCEYLRSMEKYPENKIMSNQQLYEAKGPLTAEYAKIICLSFGKFVFPKDIDDAAIPILQFRALTDEDESNIIIHFLAGVKAMTQKTNATRIVGHNIRRFDVPFLMKRAIINNINIPPSINPYVCKPWELAVIDSCEAWGFGAWQESFTSLKVLASVLGIPSPKDDISGKDVYDIYWKKKDLPRIAHYCNKDVIAQAKVTLRLANYTADQANSITLEEKI